ncbi:MAG: protein adenylyltransferase SelO family protein [Gammaproteobacteria bacterium]|nr:protein adenylyltransferase SelO family protein [Gammaproteobacteria bacterium]
MHNKLGLYDEVEGNDATLVNELLVMMSESRSDYTNTFRALAMLSTVQQDVQRLQDHFIDITKFQSWLKKYRLRINNMELSDKERNEKKTSHNPKYILRNYLLQDAIEKAKQRDYSEIEILLKLISNPYEEHEEFEHYSNPPPDWASQIQVSCSS